MRRKTANYFKTAPGSPDPVRITVPHRVHFSEVDAMAIVWHGRYLQFFEIAAEELARWIGLSYEAYFAAGLRAPLAQVHVDFHYPVRLGELVTIEARLIWSDAARLNTEYALLNAQGRLAASGFSVQMFTDGTTGEPCFVIPPLLAACRDRWRCGEFGNL